MSEYKSIVDNLPKININPLEGNPILKSAIYILIVLLILAIFTGGVIKILFFIIAFLVAFFIFGNLWGRLSANWRKLHFPLMVRYATFLGFAQEISEREGKELDVDLALKFLLQSVFPKVGEGQIEKLSQEILSKEAENLKNEKFLEKIFRRKNPELSGEKLNSFVYKMENLIINPPDEATANYLRVRSLIAFLVEKKYGEKEKLEYLFAVLTNRAI